MQHIHYHNQRFNRSRRDLLQVHSEVDLREVIAIPLMLLPSQVYKCRVLYDIEIYHVEFVPYFSKKIQSLQLVYVDELEYSYKFADRTDLQSLLQQKGKADGVLIVKGGLITDTSYANVALLKDNQWFTPQVPLLEGTKRAQLLEEGILKIATIRPKDLKHFQKMRLVNALLDWEGGVELEVANILL